MLRGLTAVAVSIAMIAVPVGAQDDGGDRSEHITRIAETDDPVEVAIALSQDTFPDGRAAGAVVTRDDSFPDSLAGAALAGPHRPILYTSPGESLHPDVLAEIQRVVGDPEGCDPARSAEVFVLGGQQAVSAAAVTDLEAAGFCTQRVEGPSRVETSTAVAAQVVAANPDVDTVLVTRADDWADSATGSAYAARAGIPLVVTPTGQLHAAVTAFLQAHPQITKAVILGGEVAVSATVQTALDGLVDDVSRVAGQARDETAAAIATELWDPDIARGVTIVNGYAENGWVYALASAINAARSGAPQLYARGPAGFALEGPRLPDATREYVRTAYDGTIIGPESVLDALVEGELLDHCLCTTLPVPGLIWVDGGNGVVWYDGVTTTVHNEHLAGHQIRVDISRDGSLVVVYDDDARRLYAGPPGTLGGVGSPEDVAEDVDFLEPSRDCDNVIISQREDDDIIAYDITAVDASSGNVVVRLESTGTFGASGVAINGRTGIRGGRLFPGGDSRQGAVGGYVGRPDPCDELIDAFAARMNGSSVSVVEEVDPELGGVVNVTPDGGTLIYNHINGQDEHELVWNGARSAASASITLPVFDGSGSALLYFSGQSGGLHPTVFTQSETFRDDQVFTDDAEPFIPQSNMAPGPDGFVYFLASDLFTQNTYAYRYDQYTGQVLRMFQSVHTLPPGGAVYDFAVIH